jgi:hypothetical protein
MAVAPGCLEEVPWRIETEAPVAVPLKECQQPSRTSTKEENNEAQVFAYL